MDHEIGLWKNGLRVIGIDEVGRGAFAGPLCVGGVMFSPCHDDDKRQKYLLGLGINDSKKLTRAKRELLAKVIQNECLAYHVSTISIADIDRFGVAKATFSGMRDVVKNLCEKASSGNNFLLTDAFKVRNTRGIGLKNQLNIIRGDSISLSIAAASIVAKVFRDDLMDTLSRQYPKYGLESNKGYGTLLHRSALKKYGKSEIHREVFVKKFI